MGHITVTINKGKPHENEVRRRETGALLPYPGHVVQSPTEQSSTGKNRQFQAQQGKMGIGISYKKSPTSATQPVSNCHQHHLTLAFLQGTSVQNNFSQLPPP